MCVRLSGVLSGSRQQKETGTKGQENQVHWLRRGEHRLLADRSGGKRRARSVTFKENIIPDDFKVDSEPLEALELSTEGCLDIEQPSTTTNSEARSAPIEGDTADSVGATEEDGYEVSLPQLSSNRNIIH